MQRLTSRETAQMQKNTTATNYFRHTSEALNANGDAVVPDTRLRDMRTYLDKWHAI